MTLSVSYRLSRFSRSALSLGTLLVLGTLPLPGPATVACAQTSAAAATLPTDTDAVSAPVRRLYDALRRAQTTGKTAQSRAAIIAPAIDHAFDLQAILRRSVGYRYTSLAPAEQAHLLQSFRQFTTARYASSFKPGAGAVFTILPSTRPNPAGGQIVDTTIGGDSGTPTPIDYVMTESPTGWRVTDILLDAHISQVAAQRADFSAALSQGGASGLATLLDRKTEHFLHD